MWIAHGIPHRSARYVYCISISVSVIQPQVEAEQVVDQSARVRELTEATEIQQIEIQRLKTEKADILSQVETQKLAVSIGGREGELYVESVVQYIF